MRSGGKGKLLSLVLLVGLVLAVALTLRDLDPAYRAARASQEQARAAAEWARTERARAQAEADAAEAPARARAMTWALAVAVGVAGGAGLGLVAWFIVNATNKARRIEPTASGQFPIVRAGGRGWQAVIDPNRAPGHVTLFGGGPAVSQPLALSESAHVALSQQASAVAAVAAASQGGKGKASLDVASMLQPQTLAAPLPEVTEADPAHIDRLLALAGPADEVQDL